METLQYRTHFFINMVLDRLCPQYGRSHFWNGLFTSSEQFQAEFCTILLEERLKVL
jgi:hypothetical protein